MSTQKKVAKSSETAPWSWPWILGVSIIAGLGGGYLITWQNLKRMGKPELAAKFLKIGGAITLAILIAVLMFPLPRGLTPAISMLFPIWLYSTYLRKWQEEHPGQTKFSWSLIGWGVAGLAATFVAAFILSYIVPSYQ